MKTRWAANLTKNVPAAFLRLSGVLGNSDKPAHPNAPARAPREPTETIAPQAMAFPPRILRLIQEYFDGKMDWLAAATPWLTEGAKSWLAENIRATDQVLEFGAGRSTIWWCSRVNRVTVVEASPDWTLWVLLYLYGRPELLKNVRYYFVPAEWNPTFSSGLRRYWKDNRASLNEADILSLERDLVSAPFRGHNVLLFDGSLRKHVFIRAADSGMFDEAEVVIVDNTESQWNSEAADLLLNGFVRLDFAAGKLDQIPSHQNGRHITTIFVRPARLESSRDVAVAHEPRMTSDERRKHQLPSTLGEGAVAREIAEIRAYMQKRLGLA